MIKMLLKNKCIIGKNLIFWGERGRTIDLDNYKDFEYLKYYAKNIRSQSKEEVKY